MVVVASTPCSLLLSQRLRHDRIDPTHVVILALSAETAFVDVLHEGFCGWVLHNAAIFECTKAPLKKSGGLIASIFKQLKKNFTNFFLWWIQNYILMIQ